MFIICEGTKELPLTLEALNMSVIHWWIDASFTVHANYKSHMFPSAVGVPLTFHLNKKSICGVLLKQNSWPSMMQWHWCYGVSCLSWSKGSRYAIILCIKTIRAQCYLGTMDDIPVERKLDISRYIIISLLIRLSERMFVYSIVQQKT